LETTAPQFATGIAPDHSRCANTHGRADTRQEIDPITEIATAATGFTDENSTSRTASLVTPLSEHPDKVWAAGVSWLPQWAKTVV
jgi:hypothetical protein